MNHRKWTWSAVVVIALAGAPAGPAPAMEQQPQEQERTVCDIFIQDAGENAASCKHADCVIQEIDIRRTKGKWLYHHEWTEVTPLDANNGFVESERVRRAADGTLSTGTPFDPDAQKRFDDAVGPAGESNDIYRLLNLRQKQKRRGKSFHSFGGCMIDGCVCVQKEYTLPDGSIWPAPPQVFDVSGKRYRDLGAKGDYSEAAEVLIETVKTGASGKKYLVVYAVKLYGIVIRKPGACRRPVKPM